MIRRPHLGHRLVPSPAQQEVEAAVHGVEGREEDGNPHAGLGDDKGNGLIPNLRRVPQGWSGRSDRSHRERERGRSRRMKERVEGGQTLASEGRELVARCRREATCEVSPVHTSPPASVLYSRTPARPWIRSSAVPTVAPKAARGARGSSRILVARPTPFPPSAPPPDEQALVEHRGGASRWLGLRPREGSRPRSRSRDRRPAVSLLDALKVGKVTIARGVSTSVLWPHTPRKKSGKHFRKYCVRKILVLTIAFAPKGIT